VGLLTRVDNGLGEVESLEGPAHVVADLEVAVVLIDGVGVVEAGGGLGVPGPVFVVERLAK
jgi:hypothetical protein